MKYITVKIKYGPNETYEDARDLVEHLEEIGACIYSYLDVFKECDNLQLEVNELKFDIIKRCGG